eukprot:Platyproteum_vivax@DN4621_c0_g1_i1.p1
MPIHLKKWLSTSTSIAFQFSTRWVQVHFADNSELLVCPSGDKIFYVDKVGERHSYSPDGSLPSAEAARRLEHAKHLLGVLMKGICGQLHRVGKGENSTDTNGLEQNPSGTPTTGV